MTFVVQKLNMKYLIAISLFLISIGLSAQDIVWLSPKEHDFGELKRYKPQQIDFEYQNNTDEAIVVDNVRTTCGCTSPNWSEEPVLPGEKSKITIEYDARKMGYFYKKVKVYFSGIRKGHKLYVEGDVVEE